MVALMRSVLLIISFILFYNFQLYYLLPFSRFFLFITVITLNHYIVHNTHGFGKMTNEYFTILSGCLIMERDHSYVLTHHIYHRNFPHAEDREDNPVKISLLKTILIGPIYSKTNGTLVK